MKRKSEQSRTRKAKVAKKLDPSTVELGEMGEDVRKLIARYLRMFAAMRAAVGQTIPVLRNALSWSARVIE